MTNLIVPEVGPEELVEVPGIGLVRNDMSELISAHPRKEDQVPTHEELNAELDTLGVKELKKIAGHHNIEGRSNMTREELIEAIKQPVEHTVDIETLEALSVPETPPSDLPVEDDPEAPSGGNN